MNTDTKRQGGNPPGIPDGYVLVEAILPAHKAFIAKVWAEEAKTSMANVLKTEVNAKEKDG